MIKILVNGAQGKMGKMLIPAFEKESGFKLVGQGTHESNLADLIVQTGPDVVVDFTTPQAVFTNVKIMLSANVHPVIGTSGLSAEQLKILETICKDKKLGGVVAPNFSIGAVIMMKLAEIAAPYFSYIDIIERHHEAKKDAPSGTAIKTVQQIRQARKDELIPSIHSIRSAGYLAEQEVSFGLPGESLSLAHRVLDRHCYLAGIFLACKKVMELDKLYYGLECLL